MGLYSGGLITRRIFVSEIWGAYFREGLFLGGLLLEFYGISKQNAIITLNTLVVFPQIQHNGVFDIHC